MIKTDNLIQVLFGDLRKELIVAHITKGTVRSEAPAEGPKSDLKIIPMKDKSLDNKGTRISGPDIPTSLKEK